MRKIFYALFLLALAACTKQEDVIIPDNVPPSDKTIDSSTIEIYINKAFINLIGREPLGNEKASASATLKQHNFSKADREQFLDNLFINADYNRNLYNVTRVEYLANLDSLEIAYQILLFKALLQQPEYAIFYDLLNGEVDRLEELQDVLPDLNAGTLDYKGMLKRCSYNYFYDQINMGTENFVVSTFQNFLFRYPTDAELANGKMMVDGANAIVFLETGKNKQDYVNIFFDTDDYYEGQVRFIFRKYMFREPTSAEIALYAEVYKSSGNYKLLQKTIFALDEYAGIK